MSIAPQMLTKMFIFCIFDEIVSYKVFYLVSLFATVKKYVGLMVFIGSRNLRVITNIVLCSDQILNMTYDELL